MPRVERLVVGGRIRIGDEDRRRARGGELPDGAAGARDRDVGRGEDVAEAVRLRHQDVAGPAHPFGERGVVALAGDVQDRRPSLGPGGRPPSRSASSRRRGRRRPRPRARRARSRTAPSPRRGRRRGGRPGSGGRRPRPWARRDPGSRRRGTASRRTARRAGSRGPRWASASVSAAGIRLSRAASTIGPAT